jgi:polyisoprenyl-phosphate glycosyltransferase
MTRETISICIPVYNSERTIAELVERTRAELSPHGYGLEFVLVNDGSKDSSDEVCSALAESSDDVTYICLRRNYGEHNAVMCALNHMTGDYAAIIDDDFQNPPSEIIKLVKEAEKGYDVVYSKYRIKKHNWFRNLGSKFNDVMATWLIGKPKDLYLCSFKLIRREVVDEIIKYKGPFPYVDGLLLRVTDSVSSVFVEHSTRKEGKSNYTLGRLVTLWLNMFINFSIKPLRVVTFAGLFTAIACIALACVFIVDKILNPTTSTGWASTIVVVLFTASIQMIFLGIAGEYIGKHYLDRNGTPQWVIRRKRSSGKS